MTTVVNNPTPSNDSNSGVNMVIGLVVLVIVAYLFIMFGLPAIRTMQVATPQINIPSKIDVNVTQTK
jgi:hypothetical protein